MATKKSSTASKSVKKRMHEFKHGERLAGGRKIKNPKQAVAIGLDEARRAGADVPPNPSKKRAVKKATKKATKKVAAKKSAAKNAPAKKTAAKRAPAKKATAKKTAAKKTTTKRAAAKRR
jgi:hypothetical protein